MFKLRGQEIGITLIALIVTVIVLIILAGVAIKIVIGENGILSRAIMAKEKAEKAQYEEELNLCIMEILTDELGNLAMQKIIEKLPIYIQTSQNTNHYEWDSTQTAEEPKGIYKGYDFYIDKNKMAHLQQKATGIRINAEINPMGYTNQTVNCKISIKSNVGIRSIEYPEGNLVKYRGR